MSWRPDGPSSLGGAGVCLPATPTDARSSSDRSVSLTTPVVSGVAAVIVAGLARALLRSVSEHRFRERQRPLNRSHRRLVSTVRIASSSGHHTDDDSPLIPFPETAPTEGPWQTTASRERVLSTPWPCEPTCAGSQRPYTAGGGNVPPTTPVARSSAMRSAEIPIALRTASVS